VYQEFVVRFGREVCGDLVAGLRREWLVTNGLGGYASGTLAGINTRRYHGLLVAALAPPVERTVLVGALVEQAEYQGRRYPLSTQEFAGGAIDGHGYRHLESFALDGMLPVWTFALGDALLERRVWMAYGRNTTYVRYHLLRGTGELTLEIIPLVTYRGFHSLSRGTGWAPRVEALAEGALVAAFDGARPFSLRADGGRFTAGGDWWWDFHHREETARGLDDRADLYAVGAFTATLAPGECVALVLSTEPDVDMDAGRSLANVQARQIELLRRARATEDHPFVRQLVLAADQVLVRRISGAAPSPGPPSPSLRAAGAGEGCAEQPLLPGLPAGLTDRSLCWDEPSGEAPLSRSAGEGPGEGAAVAWTVIAGYHWFNDWGRDTMIALPGLTLATGRAEEAADILRGFARYVADGLLPNNFPDSSGQVPGYNTVDATLWYVLAVHTYEQATGDARLGDELLPVLEGIVDRHVRGTRYGIGVDPADGLLRAGEPGVQLTWMDAKLGDWVVTPRTGKPVEINALWYNVLRCLAALRAARGLDAAGYTAMAERARASFQARFLRPGRASLADVVDGPDGDDWTARPNQIFAVSLPFPLLEGAAAAAAVAAVGGVLLTSHGLRSLSPDEAAYVADYSGDSWRRDSCYHQGPAWCWLSGAFAEAHFRVHGDAALALSFLAPFVDHLRDAGLGSISELVDGDPPHLPRGCIAQAWSVAEVLRVWRLLARAAPATTNGQTATAAIEEPAPADDRPTQ
jgi:glycogen debranching enzyme